MALQGLNPTTSGSGIAARQLDSRPARRRKFLDDPLMQTAFQPKVAEAMTPGRGGSLSLILDSRHRLPFEPMDEDEGHLDDVRPRKPCAAGRVPSFAGAGVWPPSERLPADRPR